MISELFNAFIFGLLTPLGAVCVLPLYPGFLAYLANMMPKETKKRDFILLGSIIVVGVITFMLLLGIIFTTILKVSLTSVIGIISPIAFTLLGIIGLLLLLNIDFTKYLPRKQVKLGNSPLKNAFLYGFFFGAIVIPCNPGFIGALFAQSLLIASPVTNMLAFLFFGLGIGFPLLVLAVLSAQWSKQVIAFLTKNKRTINILSGLIMLGISLYYLIFVFEVWRIISG